MVSRTIGTGFTQLAWGKLLDYHVRLGLREPFFGKVDSLLFIVVIGRKLVGGFKEEGNYILHGGNFLSFSW
jgi:hypothetical protein